MYDLIDDRVDEVFKHIVDENELYDKDIFDEHDLLMYRLDEDDELVIMEVIEVY
jgi:hypothetical protein